MTNILVFGTSTTYGAWDTEGGWVQRLRRFIDEKAMSFNKEPNVLVYNQGVSGDKSADVLKRFEIETKARLDDEGENIILFHLGINDCIYNENQGGLEVTTEKFKENLKGLINLAKKYTQKIIVIGSMPVDKRVDPMPWAPGRSYRNENVEKFNGIMKTAAEEENVPFIEIYQKFIKQNYSDLLFDGVHMNSGGHKQFYEIVKNYFLENKIIEL